MQCLSFNADCAEKYCVSYIVSGRLDVSSAKWSESTDSCGCARSMYSPCSMYCVAIDVCHNNVGAGLPARAEATALSLSASGWIILSNNTRSCAQNISEISFPFTFLQILCHTWIVIKIVRWGNPSYGPLSPKISFNKYFVVWTDSKLVRKLLELFGLSL